MEETLVSTTRIPLDRAYIEQKELEKKLEWSTAELGLSVRTTNCLDEQGISTIGDLLACRREDLLQIANFGEKTLEDVYAALERLGFYRENCLPQPAKSA
jgi:DNA-directed RNA polymerase subunit alpha